MYIVYTVAILAQENYFLFAMAQDDRVHFISGGKYKIENLPEPQRDEILRVSMSAYMLILKQLPKDDEEKKKITNRKIEVISNIVMCYITKMNLPIRKELLRIMTEQNIKLTNTNIENIVLQIFDYCDRSELQFNFEQHISNYFKESTDTLNDHKLETEAINSITSSFEEQLRYFIKVDTQLLLNMSKTYIEIINHLFLEYPIMVVDVDLKIKLFNTINALCSEFYSEQCKELKAKLRPINSQLLEQDKQLQIKDSKIIELTKVISQLKKEATPQKKKVASEKKELQKRIESLTKSLDTATTQNSEYQSRVSVLETQLSDIKKEFSTSQQLAIDTQKKKSILADMAFDDKKLIMCYKAQISYMKEIVSNLEQKQKENEIQIAELKKYGVQLLKLLKNSNEKNSLLEEQIQQYESKTMEQSSVHMTQPIVYVMQPVMVYIMPPPVPEQQNSITEAPQLLKLQDNV